MVAQAFLENERLKSSVWSAILMALFCLCAAVASHCQTKELHSKQHTETIEQQEEIRMMFINVSDKSDDKIVFYRTGKKVIEVSFLFTDEQSIFKDPDAKPPYQYKGCFIALICLKHAYVYWLQRQPCSDSTGSFYFK